MNKNNNHTEDPQPQQTQEFPSVLRTLRALVPRRPLPFVDALRIAELQANRLLSLSGASDDLPVPDDIVSSLPGIIVEYRAAMPVSGLSDWDKHRRSWVILLNASEPETRQRFSLFHEYKHILDHNGPGIIVPGERTYYGLSAEEYLAEYFAGCVLMPRRLLKRAWGDGIQRLDDLAELFDVSRKATEVRLAQISLREPGEHVVRANRPFVRGRGAPYSRQLPQSWAAVAPELEVAV